MALTVPVKWWSGVVVVRWSRSMKLTYVGPVSTGMGAHVRVQFPVWNIYLRV